LVLSVIMLSYEDERFQTVPHFDGADSQYSPSDSATYATLTPLRPPSPLHVFSDKSGVSSSSVSSESGYSSMGSDVYDATSFMHGTTGASADILHSYDFLEPLMPTAMLDSSGNIQPCSPVPAPVPVMAKTLSLFDHVTLLSSSASPSSEYDCFGPISVPTTHFSRSQSNLPPACFDSSTQSSSRASSPDNSNDAFSLSGPSFSQAPLSVDSDDELDTKDIAERVSNELRRFNISQLLFAQVVLGRSQGTLSDLLRNPKPWDKLKSGRETFARMQQWLQEPEKKRLAALKRAGKASH
jgi:CUT domain